MIHANERKDHLELANLPPNLSTCRSKLQYTSPFFFMMWDGMGFFSTNGFHKLKRMANPNAGAKWYDKYL